MKIPNRKFYTKTKRPLGEFRDRIAKVDLDILKLDLDRDFERNPKLLDYVKVRYRNFLYLCGSTGEIIVPTKDIDLIWHAHILDTLKYHNDCKRIFGFFLHHYPYFGIRGDEIEFMLAYEKTKQIYEAQFGEPYELRQAFRLNEGLQTKLLQGDGRSCG